ncbi:ATP-dependent helicase [Glutamicibacter sp. MNS18]|uniref:ATP-dependent helicase n=1 Tax=Glutamicibacter sp. MNS18 TaxID=2989817 RepID=UPI002236C006|nr:ATP-dependent DNA helicase [Glutamicibacter sp. MNS18]MCW4464361.1 ATP-dependent helicase [Glutamicibacter sp. MNS18]
MNLPTEPEKSSAEELRNRLTTGRHPVLVTGAPGTGKSTLLIDVAVHRLDRGLDPLSLLILAPTRHTAGLLRNELSSRAERTFTEPVVRTWSAYAFDLIRRARVEGLLPFLEREPRLLSGPEQDTLLGQLLAGHEQGLTPPPPWPEELQLAIGTRGFRKEVREFFDRVSELGLEPADIQRLGAEAGRTEWLAAAQFYQEYRDLLDLGSAEAFDPAGLITRAVQLLESHPDFLAREQDRLQLVLVDDLQEATLSQHRLLRLLTRGRSLVAFAAPDNVVQGFRGARADQLAGFAQHYSTGRAPATSLELEHSYRMAPDIAHAWLRVVQRVPVASGTQGRILSHPPDTARGQVSTHLFENSTQEERFLAQQIIEMNLFGQRPLKDIAIVVRNGSQVRTLSRFLEGQGIAVTTPPAEIPLKEENAVRPLLDLLILAVGSEQHPDPLRMQSLLLSRYGMSTALEIRRLRQLLRQGESATGSNRSSQELLEATLEEPELAGNLGPVGRGLERILGMYHRLTEELASGNATPETALWALWEASGRADAWCREALGTGPAARRADHDLDAVLSLFQAAERFVDQLPGASVEQFVEHILDQELPMDSLASRSASSQTVTVLTTAAAAGQQWPVVFIPGLQEGSWPNLRLRGELLGSQALAEAAEHGTGFLSTRTPGRLVREIRNDELRSFSNALSRAAEVLICTAVDNDDQQASSFMELIDPDRGPNPETTQVPRLRNLASLVSELRCEAERHASVLGTTTTTAQDQSVDLARDAIGILGRLAHATPPIRGAHPDSWWGLLPLSSTGAATPEDQPVRVSPSKVEAITTSPLNWFVQAAGGLTAVDFAASLGTLIHSIAEEHPDAASSEYLTVLQQRWPEMEMPDNWEGHRDFDRAQDMLKKLALYSLQMRAEGRELVARELPFNVQLPHEGREIELRGVIDRIEVDAHGNPYVVDLKTGARMPSAKDAQTHPQLGVYQAAVKLGALSAREDTAGLGNNPGGAALVFVGANTQKPSLREQDAPEDDWAERLIIEAARLMGEADFLTRHDATRGSAFSSGCSLPEICPLCAEGRQVTEP